jgi:tetratricopeptide (TPR) repeat protein
MACDRDKTFYTVSMARVYADQGHYQAAARIYRYLLEQTPDREDLQLALNAALAKIPALPPQWDDVSVLIEQWVGLILRHNALKRLRRISVSPANRDS